METATHRTAARATTTTTADPRARPRRARKTEGAGWLEQVGDVRVLKVAGSPHEMGRQHGRLLAKEIAEGPIPYYRTYVEQILKSTRLGPASKLVFPLMRRTLGRSVAKAMPKHATDTIRGLADGSGLSYEALLDGCTMPDSLLWVAARAMQLGGHGPAVAHRLSLGLGCTSAIAWGGATTDGALYHARNFDYHGVGIWPRVKTVIFHEPDDGLRYVSIASAGVAMGGITSMNEAGLTLTVHQHMFTETTRLGGTPIGVVGDLVMREAKNLDDAQRILESYRPIGCWTYVVTDGNARETMLFEENPDRRVVRRTSAQDETLGYANIYLDPELGATEVNLYGSYWRHNHGRHRRVNELLETREAPLDAQAMAAILGDTGDPRCRIRESIGMVMTVGSVVFRPEDGSFWVGTGDAPTSRGAFVPFSLRTESDAPELGELVVGALDTDPEDLAFEQYRRAYVSYLEEEDLEAAREHIARACELDPKQAVYHFVRGVYAVASLDLPAAEEALSRAIALGHPDAERVAGFHLWRARARDLLARRTEALADYRASIGHYADRPVHQAARRGLRRPFTEARARRVHIDMSLGDVIAP